MAASDTRQGPGWWMDPEGGWNPPEMWPEATPPLPGWYRSANGLWSAPNFVTPAPVVDGATLNLSSTSPVPEIDLTGRSARSPERVSKPMREKFFRGGDGAGSSGSDDTGYSPAHARPQSETDRPQAEIEASPSRRTSASKQEIRLGYAEAQTTPIIDDEPLIPRGQLVALAIALAAIGAGVAGLVLFVLLQ